MNRKSIGLYDYIHTENLLNKSCILSGVHVYLTYNQLMKSDILIFKNTVLFVKIIKKHITAHMAQECKINSISHVINKGKSRKSVGKNSYFITKKV